MNKLFLLLATTASVLSTQALAADDTYYTQQLATYFADQSEVAGGHSIAAAQDAVEKNSIDKIRVGVIDGAFANTDDVQFTEGYNFVESGNYNDQYLSETADISSSCDTGHGTMVASLIGAKANDFGIKGIADVDLVAARLTRCETFNADNMIDAINWLAGEAVEDIPVITKPVNIINISLSQTSRYCRADLQSAIDNAIAKGITIVTSAGNEAEKDGISNPATCLGVINVGASNTDGSRYTASNYGNFIDVMAAGHDIYLQSILDENVDGQLDWKYMSGTSFSAPIVSGIIALMLEQNPDLQPHEVGAILRATAGKPTSNCDGGICGYGIVNAHSAVELAKSYSTDTFVAKSALAKFCNVKFYIDTVGKEVDACSLYEFNLNENAETKNSKIEMYKVVQGQELTIANGTLIGESDSPKMIMRNVEEGYNYGYRICELGDGLLVEGYNCANENLVKLTPDLTSKPVECD